MPLSQTVRITELPAMKWLFSWDTINALMAGNLLNLLYKAQFEVLFALLVGNLLLVVSVDYPHGIFSKSLFCYDD